MSSGLHSHEHTLRYTKGGDNIFHTLFMQGYQEELRPSQYYVRMSITEPASSGDADRPTSSHWSLLLHSGTLFMAVFSVGAFKYPMEPRARHLDSRMLQISEKPYVGHRRIQLTALTFLSPLKLGELDLQHLATAFKVLLLLLLL